MENQKTTPDQVAHLADLTSTGKLLNYLFHDPTIGYLVDVKDENLAEVAAAFFNGDQECISSWISDNKIESYNLETLAEGHVIEAFWAVHCIRVEPFYIYKHTGKKYE